MLVDECPVVLFQEICIESIVLLDGLCGGKDNRELSLTGIV